MKFYKPSVIFFCSLTLSNAYAADLNSAQAIQNQTNTQSVHSQRNIDQNADASIKLRADIAQLKQEISNLTIYRDHLSAVIASQNQEAGSLDQQISEINTTRQGLVPLMYQMIDGLNTSIRTGKPIQLKRRQQRIEKLRAMMTQADISDAEKYRQIMEAYQIELAYGIKLQTYQAKIILPSGEAIEAEILHLGRVSLIARNPDHSKYWQWSDAKSAWLSADSSTYDDLNQAYLVATKQATPSLLNLPVSLDVVKGEQK